MFKLLGKVYVLLLAILSMIGIFSIIKQKVFDWNENRRFVNDMQDYYRRHSK